MRQSLCLRCVSVLSLGLAAGCMSLRDLPTERELYGRSFDNVPAELARMEVRFEAHSRSSGKIVEHTVETAYWDNSSLGRAVRVAAADEQPALLVVLVHGIFQNKRVWRQVAAHPFMADTLAEANLFVPDLAGFGWSSDPQDVAWNHYDPSTGTGYSLIEVQVEFLYAAINAWINRHDPGTRVHRVLVVGHSLGGAMAIRMADRRPEIASLAGRVQLAGLMLVNPYIGTDETPEALKLMRKASQEAIPLNTRLLGIVEDAWVREMSQAVHRISSKDPRPMVPREFVASMLEQWYARDLATIRNMIGLDVPAVDPRVASMPEEYNADFLGLMRSLSRREDLPVFMIMGTHDEMMPKPLHEVAAARLNLYERETQDNQTYVYVFRCGHHTPVERPEELAQVIRRAARQLGGKN